MKNISNLLRTADLTPRQRILMCIHEEIHEMQTGVKSLNSADIYALSTGWKTKHRHEVEEYNKYFHTWEALRYLKIDMQTTYLNAIINIQHVEKTCMYVKYENTGGFMRAIEKLLTDEDKEKALSLILQNTGFDYESLVHKMAFENLSSEVQADMLALYPDSNTEYSFFSEEEKLSEICKDKTKIDDEGIQKITDYIFDSISWDYMKFVVDHKMGISSAFFEGYFASIPILFFVRKLASKFNVQYIDEEGMKEKVYQLPNIQHEFKTIIHEEVTNGLLFKEFIPLCNSSDYATCNSIDTKFKHYKVLEQYIAEKDKARVCIQKYIDEGKLVIEERYKELFDIRKYYKSIAGEGLYYLDEDITFVNDYKTQVDSIMMFDYMIYLIQRSEFIKYYSELLAFDDLLKQCSLLLEVDLSFMSEHYVETLKEKIRYINQHIRTVHDKMDGELYSNKDLQFFMETYVQDFEFKIEEVVPSMNNSLDLMYKRLDELWGVGVMKKQQKSS
jgi:hypothetical protein